MGDVTSPAGTEQSSPARGGRKEIKMKWQNLLLGGLTLYALHREYRRHYYAFHEDGGTAEWIDPDGKYHHVWLMDKRWMKLKRRFGLAPSVDPYH